jgi:hypothetical protein
MGSDRRYVQKTRQYESSSARLQRAKSQGREGKAIVLATRLLWIPIAIQLISGLTILAFPRLWQPFFLGLAETYPELSDGLASSMLAAGIFLLLVVGVQLFAISAYRQKARWAWVFFLLVSTFGWGGWLLVVIKAGISFAAILSAAVILLTWVGLGMSVGVFFGSIAGAPDFESY